MGVVRGPSKCQEARILGKGKTSEKSQVMGNRGTFKNQHVVFVLWCYSLTSSPSIPPLLPISSESPECYVQVHFEEIRDMGCVPCVGGHLRRKASSLKKRML